MSIEREGNEIYSEGKIEVRTFHRDPEAHNVWINQNYFLFQRGCLEQFALRTPTNALERSLGNYNASIPYVLRTENISPEAFTLILARAMAKETEDRARFMRELDR